MKSSELSNGKNRIALQLLQNQKWRHWWRHNFGSRRKLQKMACEKCSIGAFYNITKNQDNPIKTVGRDSFLSPKTPKNTSFFRGSPSPQGSHSPYILGDTTRPRHTTCVLVWSKSDQRQLRKTAQTNRQTDRQTDTTKIMVTWPWTNKQGCCPRVLVSRCLKTGSSWSWSWNLRSWFWSREKGLVYIY